MGKIQIGSIQFKSQEAAKRHVREIRDQYAIGEIVRGVGHDAFLRDLILLHSNKDAKIGCGIDYFKVDLDKEWRRTMGFVIYRHDFSFTDFSFINCIDGPDHKEDVRLALRHAVSPQIVQFKVGEFSKNHSICCPYLGTELSASDCHVDHVAPSFDALSKTWLSQNNLSLEVIELVANADNQYVRKLKNASISASWEAFHQKNANLRVISSLANLSHAKRKKMD